VRKILVLCSLTLVCLLGLSSNAIASKTHTKASWYRGARGACGTALTGHYAASPHFACGARIKVTHHHKSVTVTIEDRCTCGIDLAPGAFQQLAPLSQGTVKVQLEKK
jgi:rare lipoprotein A (peptidoglycan hydrolase)